MFFTQNFHEWWSKWALGPVRNSHAFKWIVCFGAGTITFTAEPSWLGERCVRPNVLVGGSFAWSLVYVSMASPPRKVTIGQTDHVGIEGIFKPQSHLLLVMRSTLLLFWSPTSITLHGTDADPGRFTMVNCWDVITYYWSCKWGRVPKQKLTCSI